MNKRSGNSRQILQLELSSEKTPLRKRHNNYNIQIKNLIKNKTKIQSMDYGIWYLNL